MKMTRKYVLVVILILIFPTLAIHQVIVSYSERVMKSNIIDSNKIMAELIVNRVSGELNNVVSQLQLVAGLPDQNLLHLPAMYAKAKQAVSKSTSIQSIYFLDTERHMRFEAPFRPNIQDVVFNYPKFDHVKWSYTYVVSGVISNVRSEKSVTVAIPIFYSDRQFLGVLVAELSRNYLSNILRSTSETREGFGFIIDDDGKVIASTQEEDWNLDFSQEPVARLLLRGQSDSIRESYRGVSSVMTFQTMRGNWGLGLGVPEKFAFSPVQTLLKALTYSYLGIFALIICLVLVGGRQLVVPILKLTKFAQRIQSEKAPISLPDSLMGRKDEIGELIRSLKDMSDRVAQSHRFLQDIIEGIPYALITLNKDRQVTRVNRKWVDLFDFTEAEWEGKWLVELPELGFLTVGSRETETNWTDKQGVIRILKVVTAPFYDGVLAVVQDISQIRLLETHVKQSEQLAMIGQITTGIAHELKNPLAVLSSSSELLIEELETDPTSEWVSTLVHDIDEEIKRMSLIVNEFLSLARTRKEETATVQLDRLLNRVLHLLRIKLGEMGILVRRNFMENIPTIEGITNKLVQVFLNLLLNSMEAMPSGGMIEIRIGFSEQEIWVDIQDEGDGISEEHLRWLFNPFFSTKENGNGLGLSIAQNIMKEHGGSLEMTSERHKGTAVRCRFPLVKRGDV